MGSYQVWTCRMNLMEDFVLELASLVHHGGGYGGHTEKGTVS